MSETYSRSGSISIGKQLALNQAVTPSVFLPINDEDLTSGYDFTASTPISGNRSVNQRAIKGTIKAVTGSLNLNVEPKTFGHILNGFRGSITTGNYITISSVSGTFQVGETITGGTSTETANILFVGDDFLLVDTVSGAFTNGETITGGTSAATATLDLYNSGVYGHAGRSPATSSTVYTLQKNYSDRAERYYDVRFHGVDSFAQSDNIITGGVQVMAGSVLRHAEITSAVSSGAGSIVIPVDQTGGFVVGDSIKVARPGTGFLDFSAASTLTNVIVSIDSSAKTITVTNLETDLQAEDLIVLAPQTPTYSIVDEFAWVGCSQMLIGSDKDNLSAINAQDFTAVFSNEFEERHAARGTTFESRFPSVLLQKGLTGGGSFTLHNENEDFFRAYRKNKDRAIKLITEGAEIAGGLKYRLEVVFPKTQFLNYDTPFSADDIVNEEVPFESFYSEGNGYEVQYLLVNDVSSY